MKKEGDEISDIRRENLVKLMKQYRISKKQLAEKLDLNSATLYNAMRTGRPVTERTMDRVYKAFPNLPADSLNYRDAEVQVITEKKTTNFLPVPTLEIMLTFGFKKPVAIPLPADEARELLISLLE